MSLLVCSECGMEYSSSSIRWQCDCGGLLDLKFNPVLDPEEVKLRKPSMWRYREAIPIENDENIVSFQEGFTPLIEVPFGRRKVLIKQDHLFPSGSYKDRGASVLISRVKELHIKKVVEDSSGNAGAAVAAYCALGSIACDIYVPSNTSLGKLIQIESYGAKLHKIPGNREDTAQAVLKAAERTFYASHSWNPYFFQGTKTFAYEVCEQLGWKCPDTIILPVGNGTLFLGAYIGFKELNDSGITNHLPMFIGVQSSACAPLYESLLSGKETASSKPPFLTRSTIAEGIAIAKPVRGKQILKAVKKTNGTILKVNEEEIIESLNEMHRSGYCIEPTSGAVIAGVSKYLKTSSKEEIIVSVFTGHGLKSGKKV